MALCSICLIQLLISSKSIPNLLQVDPWSPPSWSSVNLNKKHHWCQVVRVFWLLKKLLDLVLFCCFLCIFPIKECFVLPKFVFCYKFGLYCFCCALSRSCRYHSKFRRFKPICFLVLFVLVVEMHHSILFFGLIVRNVSF